MQDLEREKWGFLDQAGVSWRFQSVTTLRQYLLQKPDNRYNGLRRIQGSGCARENLQNSNCAYTQCFFKGLGKVLNKSVETQIVE